MGASALEGYFANGKQSLEALKSPCGAKIGKAKTKPNKQKQKTQKRAGEAWDLEGDGKEEKRLCFC